MSKQFSNSYLRNISKYLDGKNYLETFVENRKKSINTLKAQLEKEIAISENCDLEEILNILYDFLSVEYPNDIIYKINFLECIDQFIDSPQNSYIVNEFKFGRNITDLAVFNGKSICYEIKSDLDRADNVISQFNEYRKVFDYCYLITREERIDDFASKLPESAGIIILDEHGLFKQIKAAKRNDDILFESLFKVLRKEEYTDIVNQFYGCIPNVPNTRIYSESFDLLQKVNLNDFKIEFLKKLKSRDYSVCISDLKKIEKPKLQGFLANSKLLNS